MRTPEAAQQTITKLDSTADFHIKRNVRAMFVFESLDTDDVLFVERVVKCWGIRKEFTELAQEITPPDVDAAVICSVEVAMHEVAGKVWNVGGFSLSLMGSCFFGTNILKLDGKSDRDYVLKLIGRSDSVTIQEWNAFLNHLKTDIRFEDVKMGTKAIKFRDPYLKLDWEVVPEKGHFSYVLVTYPTLEGSTCTKKRNQLRLKFYRQHPEARNTVKVLKRLCPRLNGNIVEALVCRVGKDDPSLLADESGEGLFQNLITLFYNHPWGRPHSPLALLKCDAAKYRREHEVEEVLQDARRIAVIIKEATTPKQPSCTMPLFAGKVMMALAGFGVGNFMTSFVSELVSRVQAPIAFAQVGCPENSCFCSDCRYNWLNCTKESEYDCELLFIQLNRCTITRCTESATLGLYLYIFRAAGSKLKRLFADCMHWHKRVSAICLMFVVLVVAMFFLYYARQFLFYFGLWGIESLGTMSTCASNLVNILSLAMSTAIFIFIWETHQANNENWRHIKILGTFFVVSFVFSVFLAEALRVIDMVSRQEQQVNFQNQNHIFYSVSLVFQLCLAVASQTYADRNVKTTATWLLFVQLFWQLVDTWYLSGIHFWPQVYAKYGYLMVISSRLALVSKLLCVVSFCCPPAAFQRNFAKYHLRRR